MRHAFGALEVKAGSLENTLGRAFKISADSCFKSDNLKTFETVQQTPQENDDKLEEMIAKIACHQLMTFALLGGFF